MAGWQLFLMAGWLIKVFAGDGRQRDVLCAEYLRESVFGSNDIPGGLVCGSA